MRLWRAAGLILWLSPVPARASCPCQMDPKFLRASCDDPAWKAATDEYLACVSRNQGAGCTGAGYGCVPGGKSTAPIQLCPASVRAAVDACRPEPSVGGADDAAYAAARQRYDQCLAQLPPEAKTCALPGFPARQARALPPSSVSPTVSATLTPAPKTAGACENCGKPGYGQFGQAMADQQQAPKRPEPFNAAKSRAKTAPKTAAPAQQQAAQPPQAPAQQGPAPQVHLISGDSSTPGLKTLGGDDTSRWLERQKKLKRKKKDETDQDADAPQP